MGQSLKIPSFPMMFRDFPIFFPTSQMTRVTRGLPFLGILQVAEGSCERRVRASRRMESWSSGGKKVGPQTRGL